MAQNFNGNVTVDGSVTVGSKKLVRSSTIVVGLESMGYSEGSVDVLIKATDDVADKITKAIEKLPATGGEIKFLEGTYVVNKGFTISKNCTLSGTGATTIMKQNFSPIVMAAEIYINNIKFEFDGNNSIAARSKLLVNNCIFSGPLSGIFAAETATVTVSNCIHTNKGEKLVGLVSPSSWQNIWIDGVANTIDGKITKWAGGRMEYRYVIRGTVTVNTPWGTLFESPVIKLGTFDIPFISKPIVLCTPECAGFHEGITSITNSNAGDTYIVRPLSTPTFNFTLLVLAVGRWK